MGVPKKSESLKILEGTQRADRKTANGIEFSKTTQIPSAPPHLNTEGQMMWSKLVKELINTKILCDVDLNALDIMVTNLMTYRQACEQLIDKPLVIVTRGRERINPLLKVREKSSAMIIKCCAHFGFTPAMRMRLMHEINPQSDDNDPVAVLLFGADQ